MDAQAERTKKHTEELVELLPLVDATEFLPPQKIGKTVVDYIDEVSEALSTLKYYRQGQSRYTGVQLQLEVSKQALRFKQNALKLIALMEVTPAGVQDHDDAKDDALVDTTEAEETVNT